VQQPLAIEAITLKTTPFEERSYILSLFSKEYGRISCVVKSKKSSSHTSFSPLLRVEAEVCVTDKELWKCPRCEVTNSYPKLRLHLEQLRQAVSMTQFLSYALPLHAPEPELYETLDAYLTHLPLFTQPHVATTAFIAKFCALQGLLGKSYPLSQDELEICEMLASQNFDLLTKTVCEKSLLQKLQLIATR
jgi:DNA repair protein RecO